ncbi:MAG TPA: amidohydrolase family protein [Puia sp.]|nr:amidohydrolase family protein [Puia sp.]
MIIDTHIHIWNFDRAEYPWLKGDTSILNRHYELDELETERMAAGVTKGVLVQAANNEEDSLWMLENAAAREWIAGVVGWLPLQDPVTTARLLEEGYGTNALFKGVRHLVHDEADPRWLLQDTVLESLGILASKGIPYDIVGVLPEHIVTALKVAERVPTLRMVFDHLNQPPIATGQRFGRWGELMKEAARHERFFIKISGLGTASKNFQGWQAAALEPYINFAVQHFGGDRCFCGGDWPVSLLAGGYVKVWKAYGDILEGWGSEVKEKCLSMNAARFYKL